MLDIRFHSSKQERSKDLVELLDDCIWVGIVFRLEPRVEVLTGRGVSLKYQLNPITITVTLGHVV